MENGNYISTVKRHAPEAGSLGGSSAQPTSLKTPKIAFYIDGFNLYHAISYFCKEDERLLDRSIEACELKWCNILTFCNHFAAKVKGGSVCGVNFFTAFPSHRPIDQQRRHNLFVAVLQKYLGVNVVEGKFKQRATQFCKKCSNEWPSYEEKQTDTNFVVKIMSDVLVGGVDVVFMLTNDSDMIPVIREIKRVKPSTALYLLTPPTNRFLADISGNRSFDKSVDKNGIDKENADKKIHKTCLLSHDLKLEMDSYYGMRFNRIYPIKPRLMIKHSLPDEFVDLEGNVYKNPYKPELHQEGCNCCLCKQKA